ncbi:MAG: thioredoxin family protein [Acidimicrobiales bacterium]
MAGLIAEANKENFRDLVSDGTSLVDVWGTDCQPCMALMPFIEQLAGEREGELRVVKLEAPKARRLCIELRVMGLPAFLVFKDGQEVARINGADLTEARIRTWLDETLSAGADAGAGKE